MAGARLVIAMLACVVMAAACGRGQVAAPRSAWAPAAAGAVATAGAVNGKRADLLNGVSCTGRECVAVGAYYRSAASEHALAELWDGAAWRVEPAPDGPRYSSLLGVSCARGTSCLAAGSPVIAWNGARWRVTAGTSPFTAVSCPAARFCMVVGQTARGVPVYGTWDGRALRTGRLPAPPRRAQSVTVAGVSCPSPGYCLAVGDYSYGATARGTSGSYRDQILAEAWNGRGWRVLPAFDVGPSDQLSAVSCTSQASCWAVGAVGRKFPLAGHWNGTAWRAVPVPVPGRIGYTQLTAVSCPVAGACVAVGSYQGLPIAESWDGRAWRLRWLPAPAADNNSAQLNGVSCAAAGCMAVGVTGSGLSYAERYDGTRWLLAATLNPA
jgi:hypothetical protein